jgi:hypothetical protein
MTQLLEPIDYPESDGKPMTESDPTRDYLLYCVEALDLPFQSRPNVYKYGIISLNLCTVKKRFSGADRPDTWR